LLLGGLKSPKPNPFLWLKRVKGLKNTSGGAEAVAAAAPTHFGASRGFPPKPSRRSFRSEATHKVY
jgi:hypothetical protein